TRRVLRSAGGEIGMTARPTRLAVVGLGRMGRAVEQLAPERGFEVVARLDAAHNRDGGGITPESLAGADVIVEFTKPDAAVPNIHAALGAGYPIVVGTTGWYAALPGVINEVHRVNGALLWAPNFAIGVTIFEQLVEQAARLAAAAPGFDAHIIETHHAAKKDAPSGTALKLAEAARRGAGRDVPVTSVRTGSVPGTHELLLDAPFEQIRLEHVARDRRVFAEGALLAARWLVGRCGVFQMRDVLAPTQHPDRT
ncbi:MAG: 4-hydroxy-tetrahydrodipicolinate reductase, partial [Gemmatimonadota bacterium]|nr:4-hydroxy-tetrahydrodipicolinate reductase [Gemmatimonadota bacterium]